MCTSLRYLTRSAWPPIFIIQLPCIQVRPMGMKDMVQTAVIMDRLILESRLRDVALISQSDRSDRVRTMSAILSQLRPGAYLLGCGPYCCGILPLTVDEIALGRLPSPLEKIPETVVDYTLNDAVWMVPREASRTHAAIVRRLVEEGITYCIRDENSRTGTYLNGQRVGVDDRGHATGEPATLANGDVISLGPSGINSYVFVVVSLEEDFVQP
ncbi:MAG: FHA domain-containing protein [Armatimonadia bacterium]|nr:FHA domain-containing protein [Armatimonadia bacterium]